MQIGLFESVPSEQWRQLPAEAREDVVEVLARIVVECVLALAAEGEADDER